MSSTFSKKNDIYLRFFNLSVRVFQCAQLYTALRYLFILKKNNTFNIVFRFKNDRKKKYFVCLPIYLHIKTEMANLSNGNMN